MSTAAAVDPNDLALFAHVADAGSFTRAADKLGLPKSTLSRRLSGLESLLGERLILRTTRRLTVTEFGAAVLEHARQVVAEVDGTLALAQHRQVQPSGQLRVSMPADLALLALGGMLQRFVRDHPAVTLQLDLSPRRVDLIAENYDLALRMGELPDDTHLSARRLAWFGASLFASPDWAAAHGRPAHPDELIAPGHDWRALALVGQGGEPLPWRLERLVEGAGTEAPVQRWQGLPAIRMLANSPAVQLQMARAGLGIALVGDFFAAPYVHAGELVRVLPDWRSTPAPAWAVFPERRLMPAKTRAFIDALAAALAPCRELGADVCTGSCPGPGGELMLPRPDR
ncbi:MAG TPA: LysR family transcriptional regulator [Ideonella sp.]|uniref:LysR family transcriptional regulator n=1 Tax=Ideonella sp. TaxID=1929293 RepID=UPI002E32BDDE|nr:LysR family transcriptional regulator [Ideonella sp.]HEX5686946.1 LysR family transcriptional regulator [Ideonella sp.]